MRPSITILWLGEVFASELVGEFVYSANQSDDGA